MSVVVAAKLLHGTNNKYKFDPDRVLLNLTIFYSEFHYNLWIMCNSFANAEQAICLNVKTIYFGFRQWVPEILNLLTQFTRRNIFMGI